MVKSDGQCSLLLGHPLADNDITDWAQEPVSSFLSSFFSNWWTRHHKYHVTLCVFEWGMRLCRVNFVSLDLDPRPFKIFRCLPKFVCHNFFVFWRHVTSVSFWVWAPVTSILVLEKRERDRQRQSEICGQTSWTRQLRAWISDTSSHLRMSQEISTIHASLNRTLRLRSRPTTRTCSTSRPRTSTPTSECQSQSVTSWGWGRVVVAWRHGRLALGWEGLQPVSQSEARQWPRVQKRWHCLLKRLIPRGAAQWANPGSTTTTTHNLITVLSENWHQQQIHGSPWDAAFPLWRSCDMICRTTLPTVMQEECPDSPIGVATVSEQDATAGSSVICTISALLKYAWGWAHTERWVENFDPEWRVIRTLMESWYRVCWFSENKWTVMMNESRIALVRFGSTSKCK